MNMNPFQNLIDNIFSMPESILSIADDKLSSLSGVIGQGIDVSAWLAPVGLLGPSWVRVVNSLLAGCGVVLTVWVIKKIFNIYLQFKEGIKFW